MTAWVGCIGVMALQNEAFRKIVHTTSDTMQLVLMSLSPGQKIDMETHEHGTQFIRVECGTIAFTNGDSKKTVWLEAGWYAWVNPGVKHEVLAGSTGAKLSTLYGPPQH